jgi:hypothetical protein
VYFSTHSWGTRGVYLGGELYKVRTDGTDEQRIAPDEGTRDFFSINVVGDWIYYFSYGAPDQPSSSIGKIHRDGTDKQIIYIIPDDIRIEQKMNVVGDWVYFVVIAEGERVGNLRRVRTDGLDMQILTENAIDSNFNSGNFGIFGGWIYYIGLDRDLHRLRLDGSDHHVFLERAEIVNARPRPR